MADGLMGGERTVEDEPTGISGGRSDSFDSLCVPSPPSDDTSAPDVLTARLLTSLSFFLAAKEFGAGSSCFGADGVAAARVSRRVETASMSPETDLGFVDAEDSGAGMEPGFGEGAAAAEGAADVAGGVEEEAEDVEEGPGGVARAARRRFVRASVDLTGAEEAAEDGTAGPGARGVELAELDLSVCSSNNQLPS